ncbi:MAG: hypothetical protein ABIL62_08025 [Planctomycetota bacterium]
MKSDSMKPAHPMGGVNRRQFLKSLCGRALAIASFPYIVPSSALGANGAVPPSEKIVMGFIGVGSMGWVFVCRNLIEAHPKSLLTSIIGPDEIRLPRSNNHRRNFIDCVKTRQKTICPIETAVRSDTICHLDDIAIRLGRKLKWDPEREEFINDEQANRMLTRPMRSPWHL